MASLFKVSKTWYFSIDVGKDANGKRKKEKRGGFRTKEDARKAASAVEVELTNGTYLKEQDITFAEFAKDWLKMYSVSVKASSVRVRQHEINLLHQYFNAIKLKDITKKQYQDALLALRDDGYAENTISGAHGTARMLFKKAVELDVIKRDPTEFAKPPRKQETLADLEQVEDIPKYLEKNELAAFLHTAHAGGIEEDYTLFLVLSYTGIRAGECCALKWQDIDFDAKAIRISKTYYNPGNNIRNYELMTPKTKTSRRTVDVDQKVIDALDVLKKRQKIAMMKYRDIWHDENFIFTVNKYPGYPMYIKLVENRMARLLKLAGLNTELTPHSLRHTHTSLLAEAGVGLEEIMERLGHADDDTTKRVYLHVTKDMKKEAAHKFSKLMDSL
ncbi:MAG: ydcL [Firmicutes bacterium]|nr:ydcL [Bacillota bacterium]